MDVWIVEACQSPSDIWIEGVFFSEGEAESYCAAQGEKVEGHFYRDGQTDYLIGLWEVQGGQGQA